MGYWNSFFAGTNPDHYEVWDDRPGGTVVDKYTADGVTYVVVKFSHSPHRTYTFVEE